MVVLILIRPDCQGYVCPGMLVVLTTEPGVRVIQEAWYRHTLIEPPGYDILRLGISAGCSVSPSSRSPGSPSTWLENMSR